MKLTILKMDKKKIIGAVCAIALFAGGAVVGAQINASASSNAIATLPLSKGGTEATTAGAAATSILGSNFTNYTGGILPIAKGGTGMSAVATATATIPTGYTTVTNSIRKFGNLVTVSLMVKPPTTGSWVTGQLFATIPAGYRPVANMYALAGKAEDATKFDIYGNQTGVIVCKTDGKVTSYQPNSVTDAGATYVSASFTYVI
jgi:hypothetical protein